MDTILLAGVAREIITPAVGTVLMGYAPRVSRAVHDDLTVTALAVAQGELCCLILSVTTTVIDDEEHERIRGCVAGATGIPPRRIIIASIQTHSGPATQTCDGWDERNTGYCETILEPAAVEAARRALADMRGVRVGIGTVMSDVGVNRRQLTEDGRVVLGQNPWGCYDPTMTVLRLVQDDGRPLCNIIHYGAHPTSWGAAPDISRDWPGVAIDRMERIAGGITLFLNGAVGDVGPRLSNGGTCGDHELMHEVGERAAYDALRALGGIREYRPLELRAISGEISLPVRPLASLDEARGNRKRAESHKDEHGLGAAEYCYWQRVMDEYEKGTVRTAKVRLQRMVALGPAVFVPFTGEPFAQIVMRMREHSPYQCTLCLSTTDGSDGYIATRDSLARGGYEVQVAKAFGAYILAEDIDDALIASNLALLRRMKSPDFA